MFLDQSRIGLPRADLWMLKCLQNWMKNKQKL